MKNWLRIVLCTALSFAIALSGLVQPQTPVYADEYEEEGENGVALLVETGSVSANVKSKAHKVTVPQHLDNAFIQLTVNKVCNATIRLSQNGKEFSGAISTTSDSNWVEYIGYGGGCYSWYFAMPKGTVSVTVELSTGCSYELYVGYFKDMENIAPNKPSNPNKTAAKLNKTSMSVVAGFSKKLTVKNGSAKSWTTSNSKVATVQKGNVTGKQAGTATITATLKNGKKLKCTVKVKANEYTERKLTFADAVPSNLYMRPYNISYDSKGNLIVKAHAVNNTSNRISELTNISLEMHDASHNSLVSYTIGRMSFKMNPYEEKNVTLTIPKSYVAAKKANLRTSYIAYWNFYYTALIRY